MPALTAAVHSELLYNGPATNADDFAASLRVSFEGALTAYLRDLPSHADLVNYATRSGHRTRPVGCLLACSAVGGDPQAAMNAAIAVELIHKSSVIRDDMVDGDDVRSGQAAFHVVYGTPRAIAVSDLLWTLGLGCVRASGPGILADDCLRACSEVLHEMAAGQLEDVSPSAEFWSVGDRLVVEERKTGSLSELACRLGARIGQGRSREIEALAQYGRKLGTAFQVLNNVRNLLGEETERSAASDVRKRRDTVLSAHARESAAPEALEDMRLGLGDLGDAQVELAREALLASGAAGFGEEIAAGLMADARRDLEILPASPAKDVLESLAREALLAYAF